MSATIVMGGSGGLGSAVMNLIDLSFDFSHEEDVELTSYDSIRYAALKLFPRNSVDQIINCAGMNCLLPFDEIREALEVTMATNAFSLVRVVQALREEKLLMKGARICNVISNAAHIPMTHSLAYNASKAAQEMITRQMARELKEYSIFGVNPNKLAGTPMSRQIEKQVLKLRGWTKEEARKYQLAALPAGKETPPESLARFIVDLMDPIHHPYITGCIFPYGGPQ
jgi:NAD(P)-dependent dehydrogenase (short-subunit alcohol dehydrogenase family)